MNNKGFLARDWVISLLLFGGVISLFVVANVDLFNTYNANALYNSEFNQTFNNLTYTNDQVNSMWDEATSKEGLETIGTFDILFKSTFSILGLVFKSVEISANYLTGFMEFFGIPKIVAQILFSLIIGIITILIVFIVISSVSRRDL